jgi:hypothetical protein
MRCGPNCTPVVGWVEERDPPNLPAGFVDLAELDHPTAWDTKRAESSVGLKAPFDSIQSHT